jgi:hypothetical protein
LKIRLLKKLLPLPVFADWLSIGKVFVADA